MADGRNIDLGLSQINVRNLGSLGLSVEGAFDPCQSLAASAQVLEAGFARAAPAPGEEQAGVRTALSYYNTGRPDRGFANGYVARVTAAARELVPAIASAPPAAAPPPAPPLRPSWEVFGRTSAGRVSFVLTPQSGTAQ
jgi:type IV secretion system protein VirB1